MGHMQEIIGATKLKLERRIKQRGYADMLHFL